MTTDAVPGCALEVSSATLSVWRDGALPPAEIQRIQAHIPDCTACQGRLAEYESIAYQLAAIRVPEPVGGYGQSPRLGPAANRGDNGRRPFRFAGGLGALAAAVLVTLLFAQLFHSMGGRTTPTATATSHPAPPAVCGGTQVALQLVSDRVVGDYEGYGFRLRNIFPQACTLRGYPTISFSGGSRPATLVMRDALSAPTFQTQAPQEITLQGNGKTTADFYVDWATSPSQGQACIEAQTANVISVGTANLVDSGMNFDAPPLLCGPVALSPAVPTPVAVQPPRSAAGLPVCQVKQLVLTYVESSPSDLSLTPPRVGAIYGLTNESIIPCMLDGYPTLTLYDSSGQPVSVSIQATRASTYQMQPPRAIPLGSGDSAYFAVDYSTASNPGDACSSPGDWRVSAPGSAGSLRHGIDVNSCGVVYVSPLQAQP
ncbi:MAG: DUF4232 domain-containing protein [Ktedonobacterales bacterium]